MKIGMIQNITFSEAIPVINFHGYGIFSNNKVLKETQNTSDFLISEAIKASQNQKPLGFHGDFL